MPPEVTVAMNSRPSVRDRETVRYVVLGQLADHFPVAVAPPADEAG
jgi:hypothetical protein